MECLPIGGYVGDGSGYYECFGSLGSELDAQSHWRGFGRIGEQLHKVPSV